MGNTQGLFRLSHSFNHFNAGLSRMKKAVAFFNKAHPFLRQRVAFLALEYGAYHRPVPL
ncbi:MAG: hypothetical protein ACI8R9_000056 [Paraglaciecola sp.]|jgi:hypothetical protein